jgi:hypothetical protein
MPLQKLYLNHITLMLNYIKYLIQDEFPKETLFEKNFFIGNIQQNRKQFSKLTNKEYNELDENGIEKAVKHKLEEDESMKKDDLLIDDGPISMKNDFIGDRSYNMSDKYELKQLIYFEYLSLFLTRSGKKN